jgi:D-alanyl-D-alanine carboxypeptidase/D-alanyl-D-alanine-endopeptidase (penicillin-binding protein 4)
VSGNINNTAYSNRIVYRNIDDPSHYFGEVLRLHLKWRGVDHRGTIKRGRTDTGENKLFDVESRRLAEILSEMNKFSTNYVAEQVIRAISEKKFGDASDIDRTVKLIGDYLIGMGINRSGFEIVNGSGFSRMNKIKPDEMIKFLENVYRDFSISPEFINSLSIAGVDGTIRKTHKSDFMTGKLRAKTGTLSGIRSLAGYINYKDRAYAFIIVANDTNAYSLVDWEGKILENIIKGTEGN